jgi:hypothetical protein
MKHSYLKRFSKALPVLILVLIAMFMSSCGEQKAKQDKYSFYESTVDSSKPIAWGEDRDIYVFCDEPAWKLAQDLLKKSLEREITIVSAEKYFNIIRADIKDLDQLIKYKNLLFLGDLKSKGAVSQHLRNSMEKRMIERVQNSAGEMFVARNRWVKDQVVVYVVGDNMENMLKVNILQTNRLYTLLLNRYGERLAYQAYQTKLIPEEFFEPYPFTIKLPESYRLFSDDKKNRFLSFMYRMRNESRDFPDKYVSIYYEDMPTDSVKLDWVLAKRKELAYKYFDKDEFDPKKLRTERLNFGKYTAWRLMGPWVNRKHDMGGGFQTFAFYDTETKRAYLIDNTVYYPAGDKLPELLELHKLSATVKVK